MARYSDFPPELWEEIMSWLPPESLKQLKLVQKRWYLQINALVNDPIFISKHLLNMKRKMLSAPFYRFRYMKTVRIENDSEHPEEEEEEEEEEAGEKPEGEQLPPLEEKEEPEQPEEEEEEEAEESEINDFGRYFLVLANDELCGRDYIFCDSDDLRELIGGFMDKYYLKLATQCDGIICLASLSEGIVYLMNPALRELRTIHCPCHGTDRELRGVGFGYDSGAGEYKVVAFTTLPGDDDVDGPYRAEVYSLGAGSWSEVEFGLELYDFGAEHLEVYCDGACYWCHWGFGLEMFSYDFRGGVFRQVPLPEGIREEDVWEELEEWTRLCVWKESVVLFVYSVESPIVIDMWVLDSRSYKWAKHVRIGPLEGIRSPLGFWDEVELFLEADDGEIKFYHLGYEVVSHISKHLDWFRSDRFVVYQKSLVSVLRKEGRRSVVQMQF